MKNFGTTAIIPSENLVPPDIVQKAADNVAKDNIDFLFSLLKEDEWYSVKIKSKKEEYDEYHYEYRIETRIERDKAKGLTVDEMMDIVAGAYPMNASMAHEIADALVRYFS